MTIEPKYDEDVVNLGYLKKIVADPDGNLENIYENVSKHYASKPQPPYHKGDTWIDGNIIYTCINDREIGIYQDSDWTTESGAREEAERKNKVFLRQPSNYNVGDMWILQSDEDHRAGKRGEILISTAGRKEYDEGDWVNMLGYGTIRSINEVADNLNDAIERIGVTEEAIADGIIITFYQDTMPEAKHIGDLWYVTETVDKFIKGKLYRYNGTEWEILNDPEITKAFEEANEARIVADGKIQSFYSDTEPTENVGVGDLWIDLDDDNKLYRYNGTKWIAVYDTRIDTVIVELETVTERTVKIETDLGKITQEVKEVETTVETVKTTAEDAKTQVIETKERVGTLEIDVDNITQSVSSVETTLQDVEEQTNLNTDEIAKLGSTETVEGQTIEVNASNNPAKLYVYGNTEQEVTTQSANLLDESKMSTKIFTTGTRVKLVAGEHFVPKEGRLTISADIKAMTDVTYSAEGNLISIDFEYEDGTISYGGVVNTSNVVGDRGSEKSLTTNNLKSITLIGHSRFTSGTVELENIAIKEGTDSVYEEFVPDSPTPDYSSDIRNVGDNINLAYGQWEIGVCEKDGAISYPTDERYRHFKITLNKGTYTFSSLKQAQLYRIRAVNLTTQTVLTISSPDTFTLDNKAEISISFRKADNTNWDLGDNLSDTEFKIEKGNVVTPYTPYNYGSVDLKVSNKNICTNTILSTNNNNNIYFYTDKEAIQQTITLSFTTNVDLSHNSVYLIINGTSQGIVATLKGSANTRVSTTITLSDELYLAIKNSTNFYFQLYKNNAGFTLPTDAQIENGEVLSDYLEHQEQIVSFPLSEGQVLHKGDYLAEDGIHQIKPTLVFDGTESDIELNSISLGTQINTISFKRRIEGINAQKIPLCSHFKGQPVTSSWNVDIESTWANSYYIYIRINRARLETEDVAGFKKYLAEQYANGTPVTAEYELAEETIIPYTPEQQEVLDNIKTFKGINYIYCIDEIEPEKIILEYYPNTPYNDTLVTKDTFDKVTTEMNAQINIKANEVETSVKEQTTASILTLLNNGYLTKEQVNALVNGNAEDIATVKEQLTQTVTNSQMQIEITKAIEGGVSYLKNTLFTIDENGMAIATSEDEFNALYNNKGMYLYSYEEMIAKFDVDGTTIEGNLILEGEFITPNLRMMNAEVDGVPHTHIHWIGG